MLNPDDTFRPRLIRASRPGADKQKKGSHFVEAYLFDKKHREILLNVLQEYNLGDEPSKRLFVSAVEYELGILQPSIKEASRARPVAVETESQPTAAEQEPKFDEIQAAAKTLLSALQTAQEASLGRLTAALQEADDFGRTYDQRYLTQMQAELERIAGCSITKTEPVSPVVQATNKEHDKIVTRLIKMLSSAYENCFEVEPTADLGEPFVHILSIITDSVGLNARSDEAFISNILDGE